MTTCVLSDWPKYKDGYRRKDNKLAHRAAYEATHGVTLTRWELVLHSCGNPGCINLDHLYVGTQKDNAADRERHGRTARGERHGMWAPIDEDQAKQMLANGSSYRAVGRALGVSHHVIRRRFQRSY